MASRGEELNTRITATDEASAVVDNVADKLDEIEDTEHTAKVGVDVDGGEEELSALDRRLAGLTDEEKLIVLEISQRQVQRDIDRLNRDLANAVKLTDEEIDIRVTAKGDAERRLDAIQSEIRAIDGSTPDVRVEVDDSGLDQLRRQLADLELPIGNIDAGLGRLGSRAGIAGGLAGGLFLAANNAANVALEVDQIAQLTGASSEQASRLLSVFARAGVEGKDLQDIILQVNGVLADNNELADALGVSMTDGSDAASRFVDVAEALGTKFEDATQRGVVGSQLFGEEGVRQVNAVISQVGDLSDALENVPSANIITGNDIRRAREFKDETFELTQNMQALGQTVGFASIQLLNIPLDTLSGGFDELSFQSERFGRTLRGIFDGGAADANRQLVTQYNDAAQAAQAFDRTLLQGAESAKDVRAIVRDYGLTLEAQNIIVAQWARANGLAADSVVVDFQKLSDELDGQSIFEAFPAPDDLPEYGPYIEDVRDGFSRFQDTLDRLDEDDALLGIRGAIEGVIAAQEKLQDAQNDSDASDALAGELDARNDLIRAVLEYVDLLGNVPTDVVTSITASIESGNTERAFSEIEALAERSDTDIDLSIDNRDALDAIDEVSTRMERLRGILSEENAVLDIADQVQRVLEAQQAVNEAATEGDRLRAVNDERRERNRLTEDVLRYIDDVGDIPDEVATEIFTTLRSGSIDEVTGAIEELTADRTISVDFDVQSARDAITAGGSNGAALVELRPAVDADARPTITQNVTVYQLNPDPSQVARAAADSAFINGTRTLQ